VSEGPRGTLVRLSGEGAALRCIVIHPDPGERERGARNPTSKLEEAVGLARAIALEVAHAAVVHLRQPRPSTLFGKGKLDELGALITALEAGLVIVNTQLSPIQQRNLEKAWSVKVLDRTGLILEIFGERARTKEGALQVELAHLTYQKSRLVRSWTHLERQRGGTSAMAGPGETQIETDRRLIAERITRVKSDLAAVTRTRGLHRKARDRVPYPVIALVGYTNAGKSTLFNRLTNAEVLAQDLLFATLDPTMRAIGLPEGVKAILSDTVGFISDLPTDLVAAFRATLEEVLAAEVILHVRDIAHPEADDQRKDVVSVLGQLGIEAEDPRVIEIWNKIDRLPADERAPLPARARRIGAYPVSAVTGEGLDALRTALAGAVTKQHRIIDLVLKPEEGALLAWIYDHGRVEAREDLEDGRVHLRAKLSDSALSRLDRRLETRA
jgi:GTP-binding protein HflX